MFRLIWHWTRVHGKAAEIYGNIFVPQIVIALPDHRHNQFVTIGYAFCLNQLGRSKEAIEVLGSMSGAAEKPAEYFVNLSHALIREKEYSVAAAIAKDGLLLYPDDRDMVGNLLVAQTALGAFAAAAETAKRRLAQLRDVHSLHEVAVLHCEYAGSVLEADWPLAVKNYKFAVGLLREAKHLNPRFLPVRLQLPVALEAMTAYTQCSNEVPAVKDLTSHISAQLFLACLLARCLDRVNAHKECLEFCDSWLNRVDEVRSRNHAPRNRLISLERIRAATIADGFCIEKMTRDGKRVIVPDVEKFFAAIVGDAEFREAGDFCYLARLNEWSGKDEEAEAVLAEAEALYPSYWEIPFQWASFRARRGDYDHAAGSAERATQMAPWKTQTWELLGHVYSDLGRATPAETARNRAEEVQRVRSQLRQQIEAI